MPIEMPKKSGLKLPPVTFGEDESLGERIARLRKERSITQQELAERIGTIQVLISDYERDRLRVTAEMVVRIAEALDMSADELLGMKKPQAQRLEAQPQDPSPPREDRRTPAATTSDPTPHNRHVPSRRHEVKARRAAGLSIRRRHRRSTLNPR